MKGIMVQGTASDVGKSLICTALCRIFARRGYKVTPFKSQNMSNNSYITVEGLEIGRAQGIQAEAAMEEASVYMNPILLKPRNDREAEIVCFGQAVDTVSGVKYRDGFYKRGLEAIKQALATLSQSFDMVVIEGAGSPVEVNLNDRELVNMKVAELADVPVILVADIERGGVFASLYGTLELLQPNERKRVVGIIVNKFRGDPELFSSGVQWIEQHLGVPVLGVLPHLPGVRIEGEDSLSKGQVTSVLPRDQSIDIAVLDLPYLSNYTDLEPFRYEEDVAIRFVSSVDALGRPDAIILPGTKSTFHDLQILKEKGFKERLHEYVTTDGTVVAICGGFQMLGHRLIDVAGSDTGIKGATIDGLGLAPVETRFAEKKKTVRSLGQLLHPFGTAKDIYGFEIHLGETDIVDPSIPAFLRVGNHTDGVYLHEGRLIGTYFHHLFFNDDFRSGWLDTLRRKKGLRERPTVELEKCRRASYDQLADEVERVLHVDSLLEKMERWGETS
jgi:adenosylcobyric acid synthase